ncbi:DUF423 domain-containing protein [Aurantimonas sp. MSK8Z-1]|uniref:DUF423 domain-containing protein n=1 Tax=Mangrovibrevibacter kandeliae TaxID=2968473 RepID=UPI0021197DCD|nr:DUF423 domain-containing protein [Aurantimonas sp. MSK8Z-1]MCW4113656.1 DUF423 domain-containing protein [Aurantimonas sp. MSK8Z-1]
MTRRTATLFLILAGLYGALGVAGAAAAAHGLGGESTMLAAAMALAHAPALLALALAPAGRLRFAWLPAALLAAGVLLFSGDLGTRSVTGERLFLNAAPTGGTLLILGWLAVVAGAVAAARRGA